MFADIYIKRNNILREYSIMKFFIRKINSKNYKAVLGDSERKTKTTEEVIPPKKQNKKKNTEVMTVNEETMGKLNNIVAPNTNTQSTFDEPVVIKKDRGLIEKKAASSKRILVEDNRELLRG